MAKIYELKVCSIDGCGQKTRAMGFCDMHYVRFKKHGDPLMILRKRHGWSKTPEYKTWSHMLARCHNPKDKSYKNYGGRGIKVHEAWKYDFVRFLIDIGPRPYPEAQIDRINNGGDYEPGNCRWTDSAENNRNRRDNVLNGLMVSIIRGMFDKGIDRDVIQYAFGINRSLLNDVLRNKTWRIA